MGWRYSPGNEQGDSSTADRRHGRRESRSYRAFAGSSDPLHRVDLRVHLAHAKLDHGEPRIWRRRARLYRVEADRVPLRADYSHDVEAMIKADPDRGRLLRLQSEQSYRHPDGAQGYRVPAGEQEERRRGGGRRGVHPLLG